MLVTADARALPLMDGSVQCVVTSPPYYAQRNYENKTTQIGLEKSPDCLGWSRGERCGTCYVCAIRAVSAEVKRVLRADGTFWLNLGDSYARTGGTDRAASATAACGGTRNSVKARGDRTQRAPEGLSDKQLIGVPWRVAFALQSDGWILRRDIVWYAPNKMPESVTDRPSVAHEYLFLFSKSLRYYYDAAAIATPASDALMQEIEEGYNGQSTKDYSAAGAQDPSATKRRIIANARKRADRFGGTKHGGGTSKHSDGSVYTGRPMVNRRSVWKINCRPFRGQHYATFPEELPETCILAGCPPGGVVRDPFVGSGTVGRVAERLGRRWVGTDLSYQAVAAERTAQRAFMFAGEL